MPASEEQGSLKNTPAAKNATALPSDAEQFVQSLAMGDLFELEAGRLAQSRAISEEVREAGAIMVKDHTRSARELQDTATASQVSVPTRLDGPHAALIDRLHKTSPEQFDKVWISQQLAAHKQSIDLLRRYRKDGKNAEMRRFAGEALPLIESHLARMETLA